MSSETKSSRVERWAAVAAMLVVGGCASKAWKSDGLASVHAFPRKLPAHRAVERVTLHIRSHELEFVGYRTCDPAARDVRAQLLLDSGISALDAAVHGERNDRISGSAFESIPNFAETAMEDLRRAWGSRSVFCLDRSSVPPKMYGGVNWLAVALLTDGDRWFAGVALEDGHWVATAIDDGYEFVRDPLRVTLLDPTLVPQSTIDYSDVDAEGVPREIHLVDLRDGHTLDVEVEEVVLTSAEDAAPPAK